MSISPRSGSRGSKDCHVWNIIIYWNGKIDPLKGSALPKLDYNKKCFKWKLVGIKLITKKSVDTSLSSPGVELGDSKDCHFPNIIMYWNCKLETLKGWTLPKLVIITRNTSNKSCSELNFLQKSRWVHFIILLRNGARGLRRLPCFKYYNVWDWESRFFLQHNAAKNVNYIQKLLK